jgi:hypothetical protein
VKLRIRPAARRAVASEDDQHVGGGLEGQVIELRAGDPQPRAAPPDLPLGDTHQQPVQLCQRCLALWAGTGERLQPPG